MNNDQLYSCAGHGWKHGISKHETTLQAMMRLIARRPRTLQDLQRIMDTDPRTVAKGLQTLLHRGLVDAHKRAGRIKT